MSSGLEYEEWIFNNHFKINHLFFLLKVKCCHLFLCLKLNKLSFQHITGSIQIGVSVSHALDELVEEIIHEPHEEVLHV